MGQVIIKAARDRDLYCVWSSVVDAPVEAGTRSDMIDYVKSEWRLGLDEAEATLTRADEKGSSTRVARFGHWDHECLFVVEGTPADGHYRIRRERLGEYIEALMRDDDQAATELLEFEAFHPDEEDDGAA